MKLELTNNELEIMKVLWDSTSALTKTDINQLSGDDKSWNDKSIHLMLNSLTKKGAIKVESFILVGKTYARTYVPLITMEQFITMQFSVGQQVKPSIPQLLAAFIDQDGYREEMINELEDYIKQVKKSNSERNLDD